MTWFELLSSKILFPIAVEVKFFFFKILFTFREGEKYQDVVASHVPPTGAWPITQACALTGNQTGDPLLRRLALNPLSHTNQGLK